MLTRKSKNRSSKSSSRDTTGSYYVVEKSKDLPTDASSVCSSRISISRQVGLDTKQDGEDFSKEISNCSTTLPRGETASAARCSSSRSKDQSVRGNSHVSTKKATKVFVLDKNKKPLMPTHPARARELLEKGKAVVVRIYPFTIRLKNRVGGEIQPVRVKLDPGSKQTGLALVRENKDNSIIVLWLGELTHRGSLIRDRLYKRACLRRGRRSRNLRYRQPRFSNRTKPEGWLAPSLMHRVNTTISWVTKLSKWSPVTAISVEQVKFDTQKMMDPEISGVEYQQGELQGYEVKEYLLEKFDRTCAYCDKKDIPMQVDHLHPKSKGGSNRISNLVLSCEKCNQRKDNKNVEEFLKKDKTKLKKILSQVKKPLSDTTAVNSTRNRLVKELKLLGLPVEVSSGAVTKWNRIRLRISKTHSLDAVCVGNVTEIHNWNMRTLYIKCMGRGTYQRTRTDSSGFPKSYLTRSKSIKDFQTGDIVKATVTKGKKTGTYTGRVVIRANGIFDIQIKNILIPGINYKYCKCIQISDGYRYY
jgi:5-methylcytosine-specific restriction endonuclease McrA